MKNKKLLMSILAPCAILVPTVSAVAVTSCSSSGQVNVKTEEVSNFLEFKDALEDKTVTTIKLTRDIEIPFDTGDTGILINRTVTINGNGFWLYCENPTNLTSSMALIRIQKPIRPKEKLNIVFKNLGIEFKSKAQYNSIVCIDDAEDGVITFDNTRIESVYEKNVYASGYALRIRSAVKTGCKINIKNQSKFYAWGCIYNTGSNVKINADHSYFEGENHNKGASNNFATITVSCFPMMAQHSFCTNNLFTFCDCEIWAKGDVTEGDANQFVIQNRCPANNVVNLISSNCYGIRSDIDAPWYATAYDDLADITDTQIAEYLAGDHRDVPDSIAHPAVEGKYTYAYYEYYTLAKENLSHMCINNQAIWLNEGHTHYYYLDQARAWKEIL